MIDEDTWNYLSKFPAGERSREINDALRASMSKRRRADAIHEMDALRAELPEVSTEEVVRWIREGRERGR